MKLLYSLLIVFGFSMVVSGQKIDKNYVVIEISTGTWCWACPYASVAAEQLALDDDRVLIIKNSLEDDFETPASASRIDYYGTSVFPESFFNGRDKIEGVPPENSFEENFEAAINKKTSFSLDLDFTYENDKYWFEVDMQQVADFYDPGLTLHMIVIENHLPYFWQDMMPEITHTNRVMLPDVDGTPVVFEEDSSFYKSFEFTMLSQMVEKNCQLIAYLQDDESKEILQSDIINLGKLDVEISASIKELTYPNSACGEDTIVPIINIQNNGVDVLEQLNINYGFGNHTMQSFLWEGNLQANEIVEVYLNDLPASELIQDTFYVSISSASDDNLLLDSLKKVVNFGVVPPLYFQFQGNGSSDNFSWSFVNDSIVLRQGGSYSTGNTYYDSVAFVSDKACEFILNDNDGWFTTAYELRDALGNIICSSSDLYLHGSKTHRFTAWEAAPKVSFNIKENEEDVSVDTNIILNFDQAIENLDGSEITNVNVGELVFLIDENGKRPLVRYYLNSAKKELIINPMFSLDSNTVYAVSVSEIRSLSGGVLDSLSWGFSTPQYPVSIDKSKSSSLHIYPNPSSGTVYSNMEAGSSYIVYSASGKQVLQGQVGSDGRIELNLSSGMCIIQIVSAQEHYQSKIYIDK